MTAGDRPRRSFSVSAGQTRRMDRRSWSSTPTPRPTTPSPCCSRCAIRTSTCAPSPWWRATSRSTSPCATRSSRSTSAAAAEVPVHAGCDRPLHRATRHGAVGARPGRDGWSRPLPEPSRGAEHGRRRVGAARHRRVRTGPARPRHARAAHEHRLGAGARSVVPHEVRPHVPDGRFAGRRRQRRRTRGVQRVGRPRGRGGRVRRTGPQDDDRLEHLPHVRRRRSRRAGRTGGGGTARCSSPSASTATSISTASTPVSPASTCPIRWRWPSRSTTRSSPSRPTSGS